MKLLLVEDDVRMANYIIKALGEQGWVVEHTTDGLSALAIARTENFDAAVFDMMIPSLDGFSLMERLRAEGKNLPILALSALDSVDNKIKGLQSGADDYMTKPFSISELGARLQALLRRASSNAQEATELRCGDLVLDLRRRRARRGGKDLDLQPLEVQLLEYLMRNKGRVVSRATILEHVWGVTFDTQTNLVESRVCHLREKIDKDFSEKLLKTVRGFGYVLGE